MREKFRVTKKRSDIDEIWNEFKVVVAEAIETKKNLIIFNGKHQT